jgi:hypothetical protein
MSVFQTNAGVVQRTNGGESCIATLLTENRGRLNNPKYFGDYMNERVR